MKTFKQFLSEKKIQYVFNYPKDKTYSGYAYLVPVDVQPYPRTMGLKTVKMGVYVHKDFLKASKIPQTSPMSDAVTETYHQVREIYVGALVEVMPNGKATYIRTNKKVTLEKDFVEYLIKNKYLVSEEDLQQ